MDCETSQVSGATRKGHQLYYRTASLPEHWWHQVHGKKAFRSKNHCKDFTVTTDSEIKWCT